MGTPLIPAGKRCKVVTMPLIALAHPLTLCYKIPDNNLEVPAWMKPGNLSPYSAN